jgi:hypothetical protein
MDKYGLVVWAGYAAVTAALAFQINKILPEPYMDEIFHVPQAQQYCKGHFNKVMKFREQMSTYAVCSSHDGEFLLQCAIQPVCHRQHQPHCHQQH